MKEGFGGVVSLEKALGIVLSGVGRTKSEVVPIENSCGRVLAGDMIAGLDIPHFDRAAMDGYAVRAKDTFGASDTNPKRLRVIESVGAGSIPKKKITVNSCAGIATGAPMPEGADAVAMVEHAQEAGGFVNIYKPVAPMENVALRGSDIRKGQKILYAGMRLAPRHTGVLAALGMANASVMKKPVVAIISTGNELVSPGGRLGSASVYDVNSRTLVDACGHFGCNVRFLGIARDSKKELRKKIMEGLKNSDLLLISGGSSLGSGDYIAEVISELGELLVHGIAVKPGKPTVIGKVSGKLVVGLPGYPTSALSNFHILILPAINKMLGSTSEKRVVRARLSRKIASAIGRYQFLPVKILENGEAEPVLKGSGAITSLSLADGFVEIPEGVEVLEKGQEVTVSLF